MSWMTQTEAAAALGCSIRTIRRRIRGGLLRTRRDGRNILVDVDTDKAVATVTQVGRHLAEVGAAAAIQKKHDTDTLAAIQTTFSDTVSALSAARICLEDDAAQARRSARAGWAVAFMLIIAGGAGVCLHHTTKAEAARKMTKEKTEVEAALLSAEVRHIGEMNSVKSRFDGESAALQGVLEHERERLSEQEQREMDLARELSERSVAMAGVMAERDYLSAEVESLAAKLRRTTHAARITESLKTAWGIARAAMRGGGDHEEKAQAELAVVEQRYHRQLEAVQAEYDRQLAALQARHDGETGVLQDSLAHERESVRRLENRAEVMADKIVAVVLERAELERQRDELADEVERLSEELRGAQVAADLSTALKSAWDELRETKQPADAAPPAGEGHVSLGQ